MADIKDWTIMVYMAGDNNLSSDMASALSEITSVTEELNIRQDDSNISLLAFYDSGALTVPSYNFDFTKSIEEGRVMTNKIKKRFLTVNEKKELAAQLDQVTVEDNNIETPSATAYGIMNFVDWCINKQEHRARNYALIISGHSFGFH